MKNNTFLNEPWLKWAIDIQSIAQAGIEYTKDIYDKERYEMLRDIAAEMISLRLKYQKTKFTIFSAMKKVTKLQR